MPSRAPSLVLAAALLAGAAACTATPPPADPADDQAESFISRDHAVAFARRDAHFRFGAVAQGADVQRRGGFWIIVLRSFDGSGLRYAISAQDGSIKERSTFQ